MISIRTYGDGVERVSFTAHEGGRMICTISTKHGVQLFWFPNSRQFLPNCLLCLEPNSSSIVVPISLAVLPIPRPLRAKPTLPSQTLLLTSRTKAHPKSIVSPLHPSKSHTQGNSIKMDCPKHITVHHITGKKSHSF